MKYISVASKVLAFCVLFVCLAQGRYTDHKRMRRQSADVKTTEYLARLALERMPNECPQIACGLVDLIKSGKKKRTKETKYNPYPATERLLKILMLPKQQTEE